jgi:transcriptional regulator with XRE-family HTH domain
MEWQQPVYFHKEAWRGELLNFHGQTLDILMTPNHRMLVSSRSKGTMAVAEPHGDEWIIAAQDLAERGTITQLIPLVSENHSPDLLSFKVPSSGTAYNEYVTFDGAEFRAARKRLRLTQHQLAVMAETSHSQPNRAESGGTIRLRLAEKFRDILGVPFVSAQAKLPFTEMAGDDFAAFMGMWLAEGSVTWHGESSKKRRPTIYITQARDGRGWMPCRDLLMRLLGREPAYNGHSFYFRHSGLAEYLRQFGHAHEKFLPPEVLKFSALQAAIIWHYYWLGDGYAERQRICTSSPRMADDLQALAQRMGKWATIRVEHKKGDSTLPGGRILKAGKARPKYLVALQPHVASQWHVKPVAYDGFVYCISLPNETMYVRRNGNPAWCLGR